MSTNKTQALARQRTAVQRRIRLALSGYHSEVRRIDRDTSLYRAERSARLAEARQKAEAEIEAAKRDIKAANDADRAEHARYVDEPTGQELNQRLYWQQTAQADLAGLSGEAAAALIDNLVQQGATAQAREYVRAARSVLPSLDYGRLDRATMPTEQRQADAFATGMDAYEAHLAGQNGAGVGLDHWTDTLLHQAGTITPEEQRGEPSTYSDRALDLMLQGAEQAAVKAAQARATYLATGQEPTDTEAGASAESGGEG